MDRDIRDYLRKQVDLVARQRAETGWMDCDPESLTMRANEADSLGYYEIGEALRTFRDKVVNQLLSEGWSLSKIEQVAYVNFSVKIEKQEKGAVHGSDS